MLFAFISKIDVIHQMNHNGTHKSTNNDLFLMNIKKYVLVMDLMGVQ